MRTEFRKARSIPMSYERQGLIFFTLRTYEQQPISVRNRIDGLIRDAAGGDGNLEEGLREWLIRGEGVERVRQKYFLRGENMYEARKKLYKNW